MAPVRIVLQWSTVESVAKGTYDWSSLDQLLAELAVAGLEPVATVFGTPALYADDVTYAPTNDPKTFDAWSRFLKAAVARYGTDGEFWATFATRTRTRLPSRSANGRSGTSRTRRPSGRRRPTRMPTHR